MGDSERHEAEALTPPTGRGTVTAGMTKRGETKYVNVEGSDVGYQVVGKGAVDLVYISHFGHNVETQWDMPQMAKSLDRLGSFARVIMFDRRGVGISDQPKEGSFPGWEGWMQDLNAVLDAAGSSRAAFLGEFDGGAEAAIFAATSPKRVSSLVLWCPYVRNVADDDYPIGFPADQVDMLIEAAAKLWGSPEYARMIMPSWADDEESVLALARFMRTGATRQVFERNMRYGLQMDGRPALPSVQAPTLVMHRSGPMPVAIEFGRYVADHILGATFEEVPGSDIGWWGEGSEQIIDRIEEFVTGSASRATRDRQLATVLFTDIVSSTERAATLGDRRWRELLDEHDRMCRTFIGSAAGRLVNTTGDGVFATFDGPGRAIRCAMELGGALAARDIQIRAGLHTGEVEVRTGGGRRHGRAHRSARDVGGRAR